MTFDELMDAACESARLTNTARKQIPYCLSNKTKKEAMKLSPCDLGKILSSAIDKIDKGSIRTIDELVQEGMKRQ